MTIPEAVQLVLQAGALGNGSELFVLDMGEPIKSWTSPTTSSEGAAHHLQRARRGLLGRRRCAHPPGDDPADRRGRRARHVAGDGAGLRAGRRADESGGAAESEGAAESVSFDEEGQGTSWAVRGWSRVRGAGAGCWGSVMG